MGMDHDRWMHLAIDLSRRCPFAPSAFAVGAVLVDGEGHEISRGYSRESHPTVHAEEAALGKLTQADRVRLPGATLYSTLEPCSQRASRPVPCARLAIAAGIHRVVIAWREPDLFVTGCRGVELLRDAGIDVLELHRHADAARAVNTRLGLG